MLCGCRGRLANEVLPPVDFDLACKGVTLCERITRSSPAFFFFFFFFFLASYHCCPCRLGVRRALFGESIFFFAELAFVYVPLELELWR